MFKKLRPILLLFLILSCNSENKTTEKPPSQTIAEAENNQDTEPITTRSSEPTAHSSEPTTNTSQQTPPKPDYDTQEWTDMHLLDASIHIDMKYATTENFVEEVMYDCGRCLLRPDVAQGVLNAHKKLQAKGYALKMLDCYRPRPVQQKLWDKVPNAMYVTPPSKGSMHNRGAAVDLTIVGKDGKELDMGTPFDFFGKRAHSDNMDLPQNILDNRALLKSTMEEAGFKPIRTEWWHYYFAEGAPKKYEISDYLWKCDH